MKYVVLIGSIAVAGAAGYFIGYNQHKKKVIVEAGEPELVTEYIYDTIVKKQKVKVPVNEDTVDSLAVELVDTLDFTVDEDSLMTEIELLDTLDRTEELNINRDELLGSKRIAITYLNRPEKKDSLMKEMLGIKETMPRELNVQFWRSPVNFSGYKLSKNTLVLYGLPAQLAYKIYSKDMVYYLANDAFFYKIDVTQEFLPFKEADRAILDD